MFFFFCSMAAVKFEFKSPFAKKDPEMEEWDNPRVY